MRPLLLLLLALLGAPLTGVGAHELINSTSFGMATIVQCHYADGSPFSYESYEIFAPGDSIPCQVGRSDREGRIVFLPDRPGEWRMRAYSEDGHGIDEKISIGAGNLPAVEASTRPSRWTGIAAGLGILFGLFGVAVLFLRGRTN